MKRLLMSGFWLMLMISLVGASYISDEVTWEKEGKKSSNLHPLTLSPEETLRVILEAYIRRDIDTVMSYRHPNIKGERRHMISEMMKDYMTERRHVKRIIEIKLKKIKVDKKGDKVAFLNVKLETTPKFKGQTKKEANGRYVTSIHWALRQDYGKGPWYHDGGGF